MKHTHFNGHSARTVPATSVHQRSTRPGSFPFAANLPAQFSNETNAEIPSRNRAKIVTAFALAAFLGLGAGAARAEFTLTSTTYLEDFNSIGSTSTATLPSGWLLTAAGTAAPTYSAGLAATTQAASTGAPTAGGRYNWGNGTTTTDRAVGFMTSGGYASPNSVLFGFTNSTGSTISSLTLGFDYERYRINTAAAAITFFASTDGINWTPFTSGDSGAFATGANAYNFTTGTVVSKAPTITGLSLTNGSNYYLRWNFNTTGSNSQGLGFDNFTLSATTVVSGTALYWVGDDAVLGDVGTWSQSGGTAWATTDADVAGGAWDSTKTATFGGAVNPSLVTVSGTVAAAAGISFASNGYTLSSGTVNLTGADVSTNLVSVSGGTATIASAIIGTTGMTVAGGGTLVIAGSDSHTGGTTISGATLQVGDGATAGSIAGSITNNGTLTFNRTDDVTFSDDISGSGSVTKLGSNILTIGGNNSYTGLTTVSTGALRVTSATALGATAAGTTVVADASLELIGGVAIGAEGLTINGNGVSGGGALRSVSGANSYAGAIVIGFETRINADANLLTLSGGITGASGNLTFGGAGDIAVSGAIATIAGTVTKDGPGTTTLSGVNPYTGITTINAGTLAVSGGSAISNTGAVSLADAAGATFKLNASETIGSLAGGGATGGSVDLQANTLTVGDGTITSFAGIITGTGGSLAKQGAGTLTLSGANAYTGGTSVNAGTLKVDTGGSLGSGAATVKTTLLAGAGVTIANSITMTGTPTSTLLGGWDFQTTTTGGTAAVTSTTTPNPIVISPFVYQANFGTGTLYLDGTNGSGTFLSGVTNPEVTAFGGTAINAGAGFSTTTSGAAALALANSSANGKSIVFKVNMTGLANLAVSYATQSTATGFNTQTWEYSTDGTAWSSLGSVTPIPAAFAAQTLSPTAGLNNAATAYVRLTVTGAGSTAGNNRFDNIQFNTPGPVVGFGVLGSDVPDATSTFSGAITLNADASVTAALGGTVNFTNAISGPGTITKIGDGTVDFTATSILTGLTKLTTSGGTTDLHSALGTGTSKIDASAETNIFVSQTLSELVIGGGAVVTLGSPPPPAPDFLDGDDFGGGALAVKSVQPVPEPGSAMLLLGGVTTLLGMRRRRG